MPTLSFKGKQFVQNHHLAVPYHELIGDKTKSVTGKLSLHDNLIIHGDNLKALKALLPTYAGKVKCIYIDPPYNTGNEGWVYNDNVNNPMMKEWMGKVVGKEGEDFTRHDKWLCMMMPRLKLLRELLSEDGAIFISIDDHEQHHLREIMDEVFGEQNFITNIIWQKKYSPANDAKYFSDDHDFILCYAKKKITQEQHKGFMLHLLARTDAQNNRYTNRDNDPRGAWKSSDLSVKTYSASCDYPITTPSGRIIHPPEGRCWVVNKEKFIELLADKRIWFGESGNNVPSIKRFLSEVQEGTVSKTIWLHEEVGHNQLAKQEIKDIFLDSDTPFDTPKPTTLLERILQLSTDKDDIVLDSFAGSGTTAQAVLELNKEDGGNRKFILIECEDYADAITAERVRRVMRGVPEAKNELVQKGLGGTFSYFDLGKALEIDDLLDGKTLPTYAELARYIFFTATGEEFVPEVVDESRHYIGSTARHDVYLYYKPDLAYLKSTALTLDESRRLRAQEGHKRLMVFAPAKYVDPDMLVDLRIDFCQLPFEIYKTKS